MNEYEKAGLRILELHEYIEVRDAKLMVLSDALIQIRDTFEIDWAEAQEIAATALIQTGYPPVEGK